MLKRNIEGRTIGMSVLRTAPARRPIPWTMLHYLVFGGGIALAIAYWSVFVPPGWPGAVFAVENTDEFSQEETQPLSLNQVQQEMVAAARQQVTSEVRFSSEYFAISYPEGDVPSDVGVSTDVVIRALRAVGIDLQMAIHEDILAHPDRYPLKRWKVARPDPNVDHRRLINLYIFLKHHALQLPTKTKGIALSTFEAGDIVMWRIGDGVYPDHVGIVIDVGDNNGVPHVVDLHPDRGYATDVNTIDRWVIRGHFRMVPHHGISTASLSS